MPVKYEKTFLEFGTQKIPLKIYRERRSSVRASIGRSAAILRLPFLLPEYMQREKINWFKDWVRIQLEQNEALIQRFEDRDYANGQVIEVGKRRYTLDIKHEKRKTHAVKLEGNTIFLKLNESDSGSSLNKNIQSLLSRVIAKDFLPEIERRVDHINDRYFQQDIRTVRLKHTQSRWGSCSNTGTINLSTRLLFAPDDVIDYVIIHELAHLIEFNHSRKFWSIIKNIMPDYKSKEAWLREYGGKCRF